MYWDGYTDAKFTEQRYPVRDCITVVAKDANSGEILGMYNGNAIQSYQIVSNVNYSVSDKTVSVEIYVPGDKPVKRVYALLMTEDCGFGATSYSVVNQGTPAIAADINRRIPGDVIAYKQLTNPQTVVDDDGNPINIYQWKDITLGINPGGGTHFIPLKPEFAPGMAQVDYEYGLTIILETDDMTFTGITDGYIDNSIWEHIDSPSNPDPNDIYHSQSDFTGIKTVNMDNPYIKIFNFRKFINLLIFNKKK